MTTAKQKWGARPKPAAVAIVDPAAADAFVAGGAEQPVTPPAPLQEGKPAEKVKLKRLTIDIDPPLHRRLKAKAAQEGATIADVVRRFLDEWVAD